MRFEEFEELEEIFYNCRSLYIHRYYFTREFQELSFPEKKRNDLEATNIFIFAEKEMGERAFLRGGKRNCERNV